MEPKIPIPKDKIKDFCRDHHISKLSLFGSVLTNKFTSKSDVDVLVTFEPNHTPSFFGIAEMEEELQTIVGRDVDLRTPNDLSTYFRDDVINQSLQLYG